MKRLLTMLLAVVILMLFSACTGSSEGITNTPTSTASQQNNSETDTIKTESEEMKINVSVGDKTFAATLEDNAAAKEFYELVKNEGVTIDMRDYSGFEKVGSLGQTLTSDDKQTTTKDGDIVLYQSNQIVMFYGSNSWSYTRLGRIDDLNGWEQALGSGNITSVFTAN